MSTQTQPGSDGICRGQQHYQHGGPARGHVGCTFHGTPAPAFPFVGARAQVTVAEVWGCHGIQPSSLFAVGDIVTVEQMVGGDVQVIGKDGRRGLLRHPGALSPVPVSPGPDQPTDHDLCDGCGGVGDHGGPYRCPDCNGSGDQPTEHEDWWVSADSDRVVASGSADAVAMFASPEDAARAVAAVNAEAGLRAEIQRLRRESDDAIRRGDEALSMAGRLRAERDQARLDLRAQEQARKSGYAQAVAFRTERDAARAELAAAHGTDGHGLPHVKVTALQPHPMGAHYPVFVDGTYYTSLPNEDLRQASIYATAWALLRARLADEATPEDGAHA